MLEPIAALCEEVATRLATLADDRSAPVGPLAAVGDGRLAEVVDRFALDDAAGALIGREIDGGRNRTVGTLVGAAAGALVGREVDRGNSRRCR